MKTLNRRTLWEHTPSCIKAALGKPFEVVPLPWLLGRGFREHRRFIQHSQWWPMERLREYQLARVCEMIAFAHEKSRFYRDLFDSVGLRPEDIRSLDDIPKMPTIDKQLVAQNLDAMCTASTASSRVDRVSTGGTSGRPLQFYINANRSSMEYAYLTASWERAGYTLGMPMAVFRSRVVRAARNGLFHEYDPILRHHYYSNFHMADKDKRFYLDHIRGIGRCVLHAYPSSAHALAKYILATGGPTPEDVCAVLLESENVYPDQIAAIETAFHARVFSSYGHSEKCVLAAQCEHSQNYHVWPTYGYLELLDEQGMPITVPGREGEIVGTGFINTVMPFIRYRTGDYATYVGDQCVLCGRKHIVLAGIRGRERQDGLIARDGSSVPIIGLHPHDDTFQSIREYQFHQSSPGVATLCVVPTIALDAEEKRRIVANMNRRLQGQVVLDLEVRTELVKTARGKQPRVIQKCHSPSESAVEARETA